MAIGPRRLGKKIVDKVDATDPEQRQSEIQMRKLAGPGVGVNQIEPELGLSEERGAVHEVKCHARIVSEMAPSDLQYGWIVLDRFESRLGVYTREKPSRADTRTSAKF